MTSHVGDKKGHVAHDEQEEGPEDGLDEDDGNDGLADIDEEDRDNDNQVKESHDSALSVQDKTEEGRYGGNDIRHVVSNSGNRRSK